MFSSNRIKLLVLISVAIMLLTGTQTIIAQDTGPLELVSFNVSYGGRNYDSATNQTTFSYIVTGTGSPPDLSHFDVEIPNCAPPLIVVAYTPTDAVSFGVDPTTGVDGIKWDLPLKTDESRTYTLSFEGNVVEGPVQVAVKGDGFEAGSLPGPSCVIGAVNVDKFVSIDGTTWVNADAAPGLEIPEGGQVSFRLVVTNVGNVALTNIALSDNTYSTAQCAQPATLEPDASFVCPLGPFSIEEGQHSNTATVSAEFTNGIAADTDTVYYFSGDLPQIEIQKFVTTDGGTSWVTNGQAVIGSDVSFKFVINNTGNVPLSNLSLVDNVFDTSSCVLPAVLNAGETYDDCVIGPFPAGDTEHTNIAAVSAVFEGQSVGDTARASYQPVADEADLDIIIIVEGPIESITNNIVVIFGMEIELDPNDPALRVIRTGDVIRVEGDMADSDTTIIIVAVNIIMIDVHLVTINSQSPPSAPLVVPAGCKITGIGNNNPRLKCSGRSGR